MSDSEPSGDITAFWPETVEVGTWNVLNDEGVSTGALLTFGLADIEIAFALSFECAAAVRDQITAAIPTSTPTTEEPSP